jgi:hypothetical protein
MTMITKVKLTDLRPARYVYPDPFFSPAGNPPDFKPMFQHPNPGRWYIDVGPTAEGIESAIREKRFNTSRMDDEFFGVVWPAITGKTSDLWERARLVRQYHEERVAHLVETVEKWNNDSDSYPITCDPKKALTHGNHRFLALTYLGKTEAFCEVPAPAPTEN